MQKIYIILTIFLLFAISQLSAQSSENPLTLRDCYQLALKQSEKIAIQKEIIKEAEARFTQALSQILPRSSYNYSHEWRDNRSSIPESKFTVTQPLFSGFKDFALMGAGHAEKHQRVYEEQRARQLLFMDVYEAFYLVLNYQDNLAILQKTKNILEDRLNELQKREELGRSRASEVLNVEVQLNRLMADIELASNDGEIAKELLEFLTGVSVSTITDETEIAFDDTALQNDLLLADQRPDVLAALESLHSFKKQVAAAKGDFFPTVDLDGNSYTKRAGSDKGSDWDVTLTVEMPLLFNDVKNAAKVKEARAKATEAELTFQQTKRQAELDIKNAYTHLQFSVKRRDALQKALETAQKNYALQQDDYRLGLVSNLDVLQALQDLQDIERDFVAAKSEAQKSFWGLKMAMGETP